MFCDLCLYLVSNRLTRAPPSLVGRGGRLRVRRHHLCGSGPLRVCRHHLRGGAPLRVSRYHLRRGGAFSAAGSLLGGGGLFIAPSSRKMFEPCGVSSLHWGRVGRGDAIHWVAAWPMLKGGGSADVLALRAARLRCWAACAFSPLGTSAPCSSGSWVYWSTSPYPRAHGCFCTSLGHVRSGSVSR